MNSKEGKMEEKNSNDLKTSQDDEGIDEFDANEVRNSFIYSLIPQ